MNGDVEGVPVSRWGNFESAEVQRGNDVLLQRIQSKNASSELI